MPVHRIQGGYQYGETGKKYYGKDAKKKAERQALAIRLSGYEEPKSTSTSTQTSEELVRLGHTFVVRLLRKGPLSYGKE